MDKMIPAQEVLDKLDSILNMHSGGCLCGHFEWCENCSPSSDVNSLKSSLRAYMQSLSSEYGEKVKPQKQMAFENDVIKVTVEEQGNPPHLVGKEYVVMLWNSSEVVIVDDHIAYSVKHGNYEIVQMGV